MDRVELQEGLSLSRIVYGMWRLGDDSDTSAAHVRDKIEACIDQGITTLDQADIYGGYMAEEIMGKALTKDLRQRIEIVTKCGIVAPAGRHKGARVKHYDTSSAHIEASIDQSLKLMGIDEIDLLLIHRPDPFMDHHDTGAALDAAVKAGKVRAVGVSNFKRHDWTLLQSAMQTKLVANQIEMSLGHTDPFTNGDLAFIQEYGAAPMAWSPLGGGTLMTGKGGHTKLRTNLSDFAKREGCDMAAVAVAWLLAHPARILPVMGTNNLDRIKSIGDARKVKISRQDWFELYSYAIGREVP
ncbi:aldo/keto reductase [Maribius pontilimi]|uniref:Aldo/keto reductase n=1 Tax=Palleronia pontilimi TaxID=1964209 RepID=A0A934MCQ8_9RHOB|nr:aldo/keto reductase [Palleronia pontilimi]MBJ3762765.1 aldo/keto reductase [Palleronia pontilimi]